MKVSAVQNTRPNIYSSQKYQNNPSNTNLIEKSGQGKDKFISKVTFGKSICDLENDLAELIIKRDKGEISSKTFEKLESQIKEEIHDLEELLHINEHCNSLPMGDTWT